MKKIFTLILLASFTLGFVLESNAQFVDIGSGTTVNGTTTSSPINIWYRSNHYQVVYTSAELYAAGALPGGTISGLGWYVTGAPNTSLPNYSIKMKHTTAADASVYDGTGLTTTLTIPSHNPTAGGYDVNTFSNNFVWNGVDNILVDVCFDMVSAYNGSGQVRTFAGNARFVRSDGSSQCSSPTITNQSVRAQVRFAMTGGAPITCPQPTGVNVSSVTATSADVSWTTGGSLVWVVEYGPAGFTPGSGAGTAITTATNPLSITGLNPAENYEVYVRDVCTVGDSSFNVGPESFTTPGTCGLFELELFDTFGDGWNGGTIDLSINGVVEYPGLTVATGNGPFILSFPLNINDVVSIDYTAASFPGENEYTFYDEAGAVIVFEGSGGATPNDYFYQACPTCPRPTGLTGTGITINSVDLSWTTGGASNWLIEYGPAGYIPGSAAGTVVNATTNPFTLTGLSGSTLYDVYVRDTCAVNDVSIYSDVFNFGTPCGIATAPYYETFDGALALPYCWTNAGSTPWRYESSNGSGGFPSPDYGVQNSVDHTTGMGNFTWIDAGNIGANELATLPIDYSGLTQGIVGCWVKSNNIDDIAQNRLQIDAFNGVTWDSIASYSGNFDGWRRFYTLIPAYLPDTTTFRLVQFEGNSGGSSFFNDILVDDFFVEEAPTCINSVDLVSTIIDPTTVQLAWTAGGATNWIIEYGAPGFLPGTGVGTTVSTSSNPLVLNVNSGTDYDWYVTDSCGVNDLSWESYVNNFRMPGQVDCDSAATNFTYCHPDESIETYTYQSTDASVQLHFVFNAGVTGNGADFAIYDGPDNTFPVIFSSAGNANMAGFEFTSNSSIVTFEHNSTGFSSACNTAMDFDVNCCVATYATELVYICVDSSTTLADGVVVMDPGAYSATVPNVKGCDSIVSYSVFVIPDSTSFNDVICIGDNYLFEDGSSTNVAGQYFVTVPNKNGCDSTININLTAVSPTFSTINEAICQGDSYSLPNGVNVTSTGSYDVLFTNEAGCDSTVTYMITVNQPTIGFQTVQICEGQDFLLPDGVTASDTGTYTSVITNVNDCDSTVTTNVVVVKTTFSDVIIEICGDETYTLLNGDEVDESGVYNISIDNMAGCDSIVTVYVSKCNAIGDLEEDNILSLYPNPAMNELNIILNETLVNNTNFKIINAVGQVVYTQDVVSESSMKLNVSDFSDGMYFIVLSDTENTSLHKFIVAK
ncbi:MAG: T9SS type A sorting domain-containing protein [Chitinophagales bacterium]